MIYCGALDAYSSLRLNKRMWITLPQRLDSPPSFLVLPGVHAFDGKFVGQVLMRGWRDDNCLEI